MKNIHVRKLWTVFLASSISAPLAQPLDAVNKDKTSLLKAIEIAQANDPWLKGSEFQQLKINALAESAGQLPDPKFSIGVANLNTDNFTFNQEPMSQLKIGVTQVFSKGKSRSLKAGQMKILANEQPLIRANRKALLTEQVTQLWLDIYQSKKSIQLIQNNQKLFAQVSQLQLARNRSGLKGINLQDAINVQLELALLEDRLTQFKQNEDQKTATLLGYLNESPERQSLVKNSLLHKFSLDLNTKLPVLVLLPVVFDSEYINNEKLIKTLQKHPVILAKTKQIEAENMAVSLAQQKYKPAWGVNVSYGYRNSANNDTKRADLLSVGLTFDMPLFPSKRQDQDVKAAIYSVSNKETEKALLLRQMISSFHSEHAQLLRLKQRRKLYADTLLPQMKQHVEALLATYTTDGGAIVEVVRAQIAEINAQIEALNVEVSIVKSKAKLNYLLVGERHEIK